MSTFDRQNQGAYTVAGSRAEAGIDQGLRAYMLGVYNYMTIGLALTGFAALGTFAMVSSNPGLAQTLFSGPLYFVLLFAPLGMVMWLSFRIQSMSASTARTMFLVYAAVMGVSLAPIFMIYTGGSIARVFFITAAAFGSLSLFGYTTKKDLTGWGSFLMMGLFGIIIAMIVNIFLQSSAMQFAISVIGVLVFAGLTAYDTQKIKEMYYEGDSSEVATKKSVMGALRLYLDFINMFLMLLQLFGNRD
ncbi:MAG: Bax inhibitor-1/YccA family protein [Roseibium album]|uniref:Inner membrane protein YbhL n=1 Tax=Roseibium album TaxID=311410 RepID=A0A0M6Z7I4_9HYPH|nr:MULTISPECIES: Bax inhibitor-1/YccA family protein [Stappiaceae]MBG6144062.1 FtsH-binding integral membrane protein [Labrenzia sp. EL_142]MBG6157466.1 FtsH-binding integral membrane protein [Labrenzia sp. EL_162]MBG6162896.1 FtsH-binding integral membrane protein [Labrenzia sp. EL_195]MBG6174709.1 FtsH-binding integral membrane protein [Labrenzia sp. EL_132]MBG6196140.1 FtsH-binding integral membrane protein [Labrenzia sp. EL_159]MBG6201568.1 FtsH-binding integral membrane protein [Labrenzi